MPAQVVGEGQGTVKFFNPAKGFGFVARDDGGEDVFVHISAVEQAGRQGLASGQPLGFTLVERNGKVSAIDLKIEGEPMPVEEFAPRRDDRGERPGGAPGGARGRRQLTGERTSGTVTINAIGCSGTVSYKTEGTTVVVVADSVTLTVQVLTPAGGNLSGARILAKAASGGPYPYQASVSLTRSGTTVTVSHTSHGMATNDYVVIEGATEGEYNGVWQTTKIDANSYSYQISSTPSSPATGSPVSTFAMISGTSDANGLISDSRVYSSDQAFTGAVRKASGSPNYKPATFSGTIDSATGASVTVQMIGDD